MEKKRSPPFTIKEEELLMSLVKENKAILECKKTNHTTNLQKLETWKTVETLFNAQNNTGQFRNYKVLKMKYENLKKAAKKKVADNLAYAVGTGGGPPKVVVLTPIEEEINDMLGSQTVGFSSSFDSDAARPGCSTEFSEEANVEVGEAVEAVTENISKNNSDNENNPEEVIQPVEAGSSNWAKYTPQMLKSKKAAQLKTDGRKSALKAVGTWGVAKIKHSETQRECLLEEHRLKMEHMGKIHVMEEEKLALEIELKKLDIKKRKLEIELLDNQKKQKLS